MKISQQFFRTRWMWTVLIVGLGFWAPLDRAGGHHPSSTWLVLAGMLTRAHWVRIEDASIAVAALATLLALSAAVMRTWAAACGCDDATTQVPQSRQTIARYLGVEFNVFALAILMPPTGAAFAVIATAALLIVLISEEKSAAAPLAAARFTLGRAILSEIYFWGVAITYAALAWRYNSMLLAQGVLISFGVALLVRAMLPKTVVQR